MKTIGMMQIIVLPFALCTAICIGANPSFSFTDTVPDVIIASQSPANLNFGVHAAELGDVNGDGYDDFVTTANRYNDCTGRAYLYFGGKNRIYGHADHIFDGETPGDLFGMWIFLADLNNDKHADVIVGAVGFNNWQGRVYVFFGGPDMDEKADMVFDGESGTFSWFGRVIDAADIDRDGYTDLILYAICADKGRGRAFLYYGGDPMDTIADKIFEGENSGDVFGREMDMGPDVNGDGYGDILFGSRSWNAPTPYGSGQGRVYLYYGGPPEVMDTKCDKVFTGANVGDQFGSSVCLYDIDMDGHAEVMVGARGYNRYQGRMYLYWGGTDIDTRPDLVFDGERRSDFGGDTIECGHFNDDKYGEILVGAYSGGTNKGRIYLFNGAPKESMDTLCDHTFTGEGSMFGGWFNIGEIDGDRYDDLVVGAGLRRPNTDDTVERLYIYYTKPFPSPSDGLQPQFVKEVPEDVQPMSFLHKAVAAGDISGVKRFIATGVNINSLSSDTGSSTKTPLHEAAIAGYKEIAEILLNSGAKVDALDNMIYTPLHCSAEHGHMDVVNLLIEKGADVNARTLQDWTPLHLACQKGKREVTEFLMEKGADPKARDIFMMMPLHFAADNGFKEICQLLIEKGADIDAKNKNGKTPLDLAISRNRSEIAKLLIEKGAAVSNIHTAASVGNIEKVRSFVEAGVDVNEIDDGGMTPLLRAVSRKHTKVAEFLVENGADVNTGDKGGYVPLVYALWNTDSDMVRLLLDKGADPNAKDTSPRYGHTPLHWAIMMDSKESTELVLSAEADVNAKSKAGETPLDFAAYGSSLAIGELLVAKGAEISSMHAAAYLGDLAKVRAFIDQGADVNEKKGMMQVTALHSAAAGGHKEVVEFLINMGSDVSAQNRAGQTPLHIAAGGGYLDVVRLLIKSGADVHAKDRGGRTPMDLAQKAEHKEVVDLLRKRMQVHDVAITKVSAAPSCTQGDTISVTVNVANHGTFRESFKVKLQNQKDDKEVEIKAVTLGKKWTGKADDVPDLTFTAEYASLPCARGDINGDGVADMLVSAPGWQDETGRVALYYGSDEIDSTKPNMVFWGESPRDCFGGHMAVYAADMNKDGYDDVIVGAYDYPAGKRDGRVYIYYGGPNMDNAPDVVLDGEPGQGSKFGITLTASDIDQDGFIDLVVGAQNYDKTGQYRDPNQTRWGFENGPGRAYLFWGGDPMDNTADVVFEGMERGGVFGRKIDAGGDINDDGYNDILIGARNSANGRGRAFLFLGNTKEQMDSECDWIIIGEAQKDNMGSAVAIFDIDDDGIDDVLVAARFASNRAGRIYIYWGTKEFGQQNPDIILEGEQDFCLGDCIECAHFNEDQYGDILISAGCYQGGIGRAYLFYGNSRAVMDTHWDYVFAGEPIRNNYFGWVLSAGDVNADGYTDALMAEEKVGRDCLFYGPFHDTTNVTFNWDTTNASIGKHTLKVEIPPVPGEKNTEDNIKTVTIEVKEPRR
jgi:ankyrin repeat protein